MACNCHMCGILLTARPALFNVKHEYFQNSFFLSTVIKRNKLDNNVQNSESVSAFNEQINP